MFQFIHVDIFTESQSITISKGVEKPNQRGLKTIRIKENKEIRSIDHFYQEIVSNYYKWKKNMSYRELDRGGAHNFTDFIFTLFTLRLIA